MWRMYGNAPPDRAVWTHRVFDDFGITEHRLTMGTQSRPDNLNIYRMSPGQQRNSLAIVSRESARDAIQLAIPSGSNSRPVMGVQFGDDWYFTAHALTGCGVDAPVVIDRIRTFMAGRPGQDYMILADFNRSPERMPTRLQNHD
jgi:hypothetical protein